MLLLIADTSGKHGSIALAQAGAADASRDTNPAKDEIEILETVPLTGGAFSAELIPQVAEMVARYGKTKNDLDAFCVVSGPGSFTGLRVGLAAIKGLSEALRKTIVAISLLEAVAASAGVSGRIFAALDAGRGDIYTGDCSVDSNSAPSIGPTVLRHGERLLNLEEFVSEVNSEPQKRVVTPDPALAERLREANLDCQIVSYPDSAILAKLGRQRLQKGETISAEALEANYIRRSDAEIFAKPAGERGSSR